MPKDQYGNPLDICLNPMGVTGRMNLGQNYEMELNFIAENLIRELKENTELDTINKLKRILKFYKIANKEQYTFIKNSLNKMTDKERNEFLEDCFEKGLFIHQSPFFGNASIETMNELYEEFGYHPYEFTYKGKKISEPLVAGDIYYIRLKHDPKTKMSARSSGDLSINNIPSKSSSFKYHTSLFSKTPIRCGEMELTSLLLTKKMPEVSRYLAQTSSSPEDRRNFNTAILTRNPFDIGRVDIIKKQSITSKIVETELLALGVKNVDNSKLIKKKDK